MEISIGDLLKARIEASQRGELGEQLVLDRKEYNKKWAEAVHFFALRVNKERKREKVSELDFIAVRQKLCHIKEIDDLRWFYKQCLEYENKRDNFGRRIKGNTFNKCFFGALKIR